MLVMYFSTKHILDDFISNVTIDIIPNLIVLARTCRVLNAQTYRMN